MVAGGESVCLAVGEEMLVGSANRIYRLLQASQLPDPVTSISIGSNPRSVYAATTRGVHRSVDGGEHFMPWSDHLPDLPVLALQQYKHDLYALGFGGMLWRRAL